MTNLAPLVAHAPDPLVPEDSPLAMPVRPLGHPPAPAAALAPDGIRGRRWTVAALAVAAVALLGWLMGAGLLRDGYAHGDAVMLALYLPNVAWTAFAAATALCGYFWTRRSPAPRTAPEGWKPRGRTAILIPARNEDVADLEARIAALRTSLTRLGFWRSIDIFVLSDSGRLSNISAEAAMANGFARDPAPGPAVFYRRRRNNAQRKPGNIADWVRRWGGAYAYMLMLDADSRMSAVRIAGLIHRMETNPHLGLIQTGIQLTGAVSRFARLQQLATRLYGPAFAAGIAGWSGNAGNYWGHNALIRVRAFAAAGGLPRLAGRPPIGGDVLSHDFVEAAWLRRAGWGVEIDPSSRGSAEGGPETLAAYHKRDRRWCQGNLQHGRILLNARGLDPASRLHMLCGIAGYLAAPLWLALVAGAALFGPSGGVTLAFVGALGLILVQKLAGVLCWMRRRPAARGKLARMALGELAVSAVLAPVIMVRQTVAVFAVLAGNDCGWKPAGRAGRRANADDMPWLEPAVGISLLLGVLPGDLSQLAFVAPIVLPLVAAPWIVQWLDLPPGRLPAWAPPALAPAPAAVTVRR